MWVWHWSTPAKPAMWAESWRLIQKWSFSCGPHAGFFCSFAYRLVSNGAGVGCVLNNVRRGSCILLYFVLIFNFFVRKTFDETKPDRPWKMCPYFFSESLVVGVLLSQLGGVGTRSWTLRCVIFTVCFLDPVRVQNRMCDQQQSLHIHTHIFSYIHKS